jgi:hypothetical protein
MQQEYVVRPAVRRQVLDVRADDVRRLLRTTRTSKPPICGSPSRLSQRLGVRTRREQVSQAVALVMVVSDNEGLASPVQRKPTADGQENSDTRHYAGNHRGTGVPAAASASSRTRVP